MNSFLADIKGHFSRSGNTLNKLILVNVIVFVVLILFRVILFLSGAETYYQLTLRFISMPAHWLVFLTRPWTLLTYFFTHEGFFHILFNLLNLYYFGQLVQEYLGSRKLLSLYMLGGIAGGLLYLLAFNTIPYYEHRVLESFMVGASASVLAIIVAAATLLPDYTFFLFIFGAVRIKYIAAVLVLVSISGIVGSNAGGNVAHLGGALLGFFYIKQLQRGRDMGRPVMAVFDFFERLFSPKPAIRVTHRAAAPRPAAPEAPRAAGTPTQLEIDRILDKISKSGYESLTKDEKQKLFRASQGEA